MCISIKNNSGHSDYILVVAQNVADTYNTDYFRSVSYIIIIHCIYIAPVSVLKTSPRHSVTCQSHIL